MSKRVLFRVTAVSLGTALPVLAWMGLSELSRQRNASRPVNPARIQERFNESPRSIYCFDKVLSYRLKPGFTGIRHGTENSVHHTNSRGLLGSAELNPASAVPQILFLGDSVTYGDGVAEDVPFASQLQRTFAGRADVWNGGCPGWTTRQELDYFDTYLADAKWDLIVVVFCLNDLLSYEWVFQSKSRFQLAADTPEYHGAAGLYYRMRLRLLRDRFRSDTATGPLADQNDGCLLSWTDRRWKDYGRFLRGRLANRRTRILFVAAPTRSQMRSLARSAKSQTVLFPQRRLAETLQGLGIRCLMGEKALEASKNNPDVYYIDDLHFSKAGHDAMAAFLEQPIAETLNDIERARLPKAGPNDVPTDSRATHPAAETAAASQAHRAL